MRVDHIFQGKKKGKGNFYRKENTKPVTIIIIINQICFNQNVGKGETNVSLVI